MYKISFFKFSFHNKCERVGCGRGVGCRCRTPTTLKFDKFNKIVKIKIVRCKNEYRSEQRK